MDRWRRTHEAVSRAALELFLERGYDVTTTAQVAERAGVSEMTVFRHFPAKEALLLEDPFDPLIADAVRARPAGEPPMRALTEGIRQTWTHLDSETLAQLRIRLRLVAEASGLRGAVERNSAQTITALSEALRDRGSGAVEARVAATATVSGLSAALLHWAQAEHAPLSDVLNGALDALGGA